MRFDLRFETTVDSPADEVWVAATTLDGIVAELPRPMRLRTTPAIRTLDELLATGSKLVATLVLGPVPVLRWSPGIELLDVEGRRFVETSTDMSWMQAWRHERRVVELGAGTCRVEDRVSGSSRLPLAGAVVRWLFRARHRRIARSAA